MKPVKTNRNQWTLMTVKKITVAALAATILFNCKKDKPEEEIIIEPEQSILILNEGTFDTGTAEITLYNSATKVTTQNVFERQNARPLGDVGQSIYRYNDRYYVVLNNSNKIEVVDKNIKSVQVFINLEMPRYMAFSENKAYVSSWGDGFGGQVYVIDLTTGNVLKTIATDGGSEKMLLHGNILYVANSGGFGYANTVSLIDIQTDILVRNIEVGDNPSEIVLHDASHIWVINAGQYNTGWELEGKGLALVNISTGEVEKKFDLAPSSSILNSLLINGDTLYYNHSGVYKMSIFSDGFPSAPFIGRNYNFVQFDEGKSVLYGFSGDYTTSGSVHIINMQTGTVIETIVAGIGPRSVVGD